MPVCVTVEQYTALVLFSSFAAFVLAVTRPEPFGPQVEEYP